MFEQFSTAVVFYADEGYQIAKAHGAPYPPQEQALGETPSVMPDVPICAVFLFMFITAAAGHMTLFRLNLSRGKKFVLSGMVFGESIAEQVA